MTRVVAFDTETYPVGYFPEGKSRDSKVGVNPVPRLVCMTSHDGNRTEITRGNKAVDQFIYWLTHENTHIVAHNTAFDVCVMIRAAWEFRRRDILPEVFAAYEQGRIHDTRVREQLLDIAKLGLKPHGYGLDKVVKRYFKVDISKDKKGEDIWRGRYNELDPWPTEYWPTDAVRYAKDDAMWAFRCYMEQQQPHYACTNDQISGQNGVENEQLQTMAMFAFQLMSIWGMRVDLPWALDIERKYSALQADLAVKLQGYGILREDGTENQAEKQRIFAAAFASVGEPVMMTPPSTTFPEGQIMTSTKARTRLEDLGITDKDERFRLISLWAKLNKFQSSYIQPILLAHPYPVCTRFDLVESGRSSSSKPNLQNLPKRDRDEDPFKASDIRRAFIPRDGNVFIDADYSTLELRTLAQICLNFGWRSAMADALLAGRDLHTDFAAQLLGMDYFELEAILSNHNHPTYKEAKKNRNLAKVANFGYPGGLGSKAFVSYARGMGQRVDAFKAEELRQAWKMRWPEMNYYLNYPRDFKLPGTHRTVTGDLYGVYQHGPLREIGTWRVRGCDRYTSSCNTLFQGMAADGCKMAMWKIMRACYVDKQSPLYGYRPNIFVHDQFVLEGPERGASAAAHELVRLMREGMDIMVPDIPIESTVALGRRWDVDMESEMDDNGEFKIYEAA